MRTNDGACCDEGTRAFPEKSVGATMEELTSPDSILQILERAKKTVQERESHYGSDGYRQLGEVMGVLFPLGMQIHSPEEFARYYLLEKIVEKLCRYVRSYADGGHPDSIHDLGNYAFKLEEHDGRARYRG